MPESFGGAVPSSGTLAVTVNPESVEASGVPEFVGLSAMIKMDVDGTVHVRVAGHATYGNPPRDVAVIEDVDLAATDIDEQLRSILDLHAAVLQRRAIRAAGNAWEIAIRQKEMDE